MYRQQIQVLYQKFCSWQIVHQRFFQLLQFTATKLLPSKERSIIKEVLSVCSLVFQFNVIFLLALVVFRERYCVGNITALSIVIGLK